MVWTHHFSHRLCHRPPCSFYLALLVRPPRCVLTPHLHAFIAAPNECVTRKARHQGRIILTSGSRERGKYQLNKKRLKLPSNTSTLPLAIVTRVYFELTKLLANLVPSREHPIGSPVSSKGSLAGGSLRVGLVWRDATR